MQLVENGEENKMPCTPASTGGLFDAIRNGVHVFDDFLQHGRAASRQYGV